MTLIPEAYPIIDLHCDLLLYLAQHPEVGVEEAAMGASLPYLQQGGVKLQVLAIFSMVDPQSTDIAYQQSLIYKKLLEDQVFIQMPWNKPEAIFKKTGITAVAAIENAAGFCTESDPLDKGFQQLERIIENTGQLLYISMTHHTENRFGGGNYSDKGLKADGEVLLDWMDGKNIAIDFSHTSDALAYGILNYTEKKGLKIPIIASHSNYRNLWKHPRNLPVELVKEIVNRNGLIGMNFLRAFVDDNRKETFYDHIEYGFRVAPEAISFGADFFYTGDHPDQSRMPFFYEGLNNATAYPGILKHLKEKGITEKQLMQLSYENALNYLGRLS